MREGPPEPLSRLLERLRARLVRERWLGAVLVGLSVASFAAGVCWLTYGRSALVAWLAVVGGLVATGSAVLVARNRRRLTLPVLARVAEHRLDLHQLFSTTVETARATSAVTAALHGEASRLANTATVEAIAPRQVRGRSLAVLGCAIGIAVLGAALPGGGARLLSAVRPDDSRQSDVSIERVLDLAASLDAVATEGKDSLLAALAEALRALAQDRAATANGVVTDRDALEDLLGTVARAMGSGLTGAQLANTLAQPTLGAATQRPGASSDRGGGQNAGETLADVPLQQAEAHDDLMALLQGPPSSSPPTAAVDAAPSSVDRQGSATGDYLTGARQALADQQPSQGDPNTAAAIIGASNESSAGASQLAGQGTQELAGDATMATGADAADLVAVAGRQREDGRQVEMELTPTSDQATDGSEPFSVGAWTTTREAAVRVDDLPARYRMIAGRYFLPSQDTRDTTASRSQ